MLSHESDKLSQMKDVSEPSPADEGVQRLSQDERTDDDPNATTELRQGQTPYPAQESTPADRRRWALAAPYIRGNRASGSTGKWRMERIQDFPPVRDAVQEHTVIVWAIFLLAGIFYGGLHALAWSIPFPTHTQQLLWRLSSGVLVGYGLLCLLARLLYPLALSRVTALRSPEEMPDNKPRQRARKLRNVALDSSLSSMISLVVLVGYAAIIFTSVIALVAYMLARGFLLVECFILLFHAPAGTFSQVRWVSMLPHFS